MILDLQEQGRKKQLSVGHVLPTSSRLLEELLRVSLSDSGDTWQDVREGKPLPKAFLL